MNGEMPAGLSFVYPDQKSDGKQRGTGGDHGKQKNEEPAQIFLLRSLAYVAVGCHQNHHPGKRENNNGERVPACNQCTCQAKMCARGKEYRRAGSQSQHETMTRVLTTNKINNAHLWR